MVGGGRAHGPSPRDYSQNLPKKVNRLARRVALSDKVRNQKVFVVENFKYDAPKTKQVLSLLNNLKVDDRKVMIIAPEKDDNLYRSARNIPYKSVCVAPQFSAYDVINSEALIIQKGSVEILNEVVGEMKDPRDVVLEPILTEKAVLQQELANQYTFKVAGSANKIDVRHAITKRFGVDVKSVRIVNVKPKPRQRLTRAGRIAGATSRYKKAIVTLQEGSRLDFLESV